MNDRSTLISALCEHPQCLTAAGRLTFFREILGRNLWGIVSEDIAWEGNGRTVLARALRMLEGHEAEPGIQAIDVITDALFPPVSTVTAPTTTPLPTFSPGHQLGHFRIESEIDRGGQGVVYRAIDTRTGTAVALKMVPKIALPPGTRRWRTGSNIPG